MQIKSITIKNFRNIKNINIEADNNMNIISGENAQGKTNIIEAIWFFTGAKSFRNNKDTVYVKFGEEKAVLQILYDFKGCENEIKIEIENNKRTAFINGKKLSSPSLLAGNFNAVIFSPSDLSIIKDSPLIRRKFLDISIGQIYPVYIEILSAYSRAVIQRNKIIKDYKYDKTLSIMLDVFEKEIAENGEKIIEYRKKYISVLEKYVPNIYSGLSSGKEDIKTEYIINCKREEIIDNLKNARTADMLTGTTSVGPHRDDIDFKINGISARSFGSQGQQRSVALALKLAGAEVIKKITDEYPVCLLDDCLSELDPARQNYIINHIKSRQVFLTCCDPANTNSLIKGKIFNIEKGAIKK
ncbi:MAG: DNA replication/repair protein RecF [Clostridia bacterium]|nr:DNA replication/repair protein RecF [Clostridia bacterium]